MLLSTDTTESNVIDDITSLLDGIVEQFQYIWTQIVAMYEQIAASLSAVFGG